MALETSNKIKLTEEDMWVGIDASPQFIHLAIRPSHETYRANVDEEKVIELKAQILSALKLQELVKNLNSDQVEDWIIESQHGKYLEDGTDEQKLCDCIKSLIKESEKL